MGKKKKKGNTQKQELKTYLKWNVPLYLALSAQLSVSLVFIFPLVYLSFSAFHVDVSHHEAEILSHDFYC